MAEKVLYLHFKVEIMSESKPYIVSARKYRPSTFSTVVGQEALTRTLKNAIDSGRLAQAYLFCGPRGVGKTSCARIFAKTINCLSPTPDGEACGHCDSCRAIEEGNSYNIIELDAASNNSVDDIRSITEQVNIPPQVGKYRVFIIDEVHMLSNQAFNAFLKTLEEPPKYVIFILATTEKHKVIPTILSRCQIYDFKRITIDDMSRHLQYVADREGLKADPAALNVIAQKADGAMRDALSIFDQVAASCMGEITYARTIENLNVLDYDYYFRLTEAFRQGDVGSALLLYKEIRDKGFDSLFFVNGLAGHVRNLMVAADRRTVPLLEVSKDVGARYVEQAQSMPLQWYYKAIGVLNDCDLSYRNAGNKQLHVELALIRLTMKPEVNDEKGEKDPLPSQKAVARPQQPRQETKADTKPAVSPETEKPVEKKSEDRPKTMARTYAPAGSPNVAVRPRTTIRINQKSDAANASERPASSEHGAARDAAYTDDDVAEAWQKFINSHSDRHILVNSMRTARPERQSDGTFVVKVENPAQQQQFEANMAEIVGFLRGELSNDMFRLRAAIADASEVPHAMPPKEFLKKIVSDNPVIGSLLNDIDAELS